MQMPADDLARAVGDGTRVGGEELDAAESLKPALFRAKFGHRLLEDHLVALVDGAGFGRVGEHERTEKRRIGEVGPVPRRLDAELADAPEIVRDAERGQAVAVVAALRVVNLLAREIHGDDVVGEPVGMAILHARVDRVAD